MREDETRENEMIELGAVSELTQGGIKKDEEDDDFLV